MKKCIRCYVMKKALCSIGEFLILVAVAAALIGICALLDLGIKWSVKNYPDITFCITLGLLWVCFSKMTMGCTRWIRKLIAEARRECGE